MTRPVLYFDVGSPFVYLAAARAEAVLGVDPLWRPAPAAERPAQALEPQMAR